LSELEAGVAGDQVGPDFYIIRFQRYDPVQAAEPGAEVINGNLTTSLAVF